MLKITPAGRQLAWLHYAQISSIMTWFNNASTRQTLSDSFATVYQQ